MKRFRYEKPILADFNEDMTCRGYGTCGTGDDIHECCNNGSCPVMAYCHTGNGAAGCFTGSNACDGGTWYTECSTGSGVTGNQSTATKGSCTPGSVAYYTCTNGGTTYGMAGCGNGSDPRSSSCS
jgi:hypothetical protein